MSSPWTDDPTIFLRWYGSHSLRRGEPKHFETLEDLATDLERQLAERDEVLREADEIFKGVLLAAYSTRKIEDCRNRIRLLGES